MGQEPWFWPLVREPSIEHESGYEGHGLPWPCHPGTPTPTLVSTGTADTAAPTGSRVWNSAMGS